MNNKIYLVSPEDVKAESQINYNVDSGVLATAIRTAQNIYLRDIIGDNLLESLQDKVEDGTIDDDENVAYLTLLDEYVSEFLVSKANVEICVPISLKIRNIGVSQDSDTNISSSVLSDIKYLASYYETQACDKANRLIDFLKNNKASFPELEDCPCGKKKPNLSLKYANTNLWLG